MSYGITKQGNRCGYQSSSLGHYTVLCVAGYLMRPYGRLRNSGNGSWKETYLLALRLSLGLRASLALIYSNLYKSKLKPFGLSISIRNGI